MAMARLLAAAVAVGLAAPQTEVCEHCPVMDAFADFLKSDKDINVPFSEVYDLWSTHVEVVSLTTDAGDGGFELPSFHKNLAKEAVRGWKAFSSNIAPKLEKDHPFAGKDGFFKYQQRLFETSGRAATDLEAQVGAQPSLDDPVTWPELHALPEYMRLRNIVEKFSRRYLARSGMTSDTANSLNYSIFNWAHVTPHGKYQPAKTHPGDYHVAAFFAQTGKDAGKFVLSDPRGHSTPFGRLFQRDFQPGELIIFPAWLSHMTTVMQPRDTSNDQEHVVFFFHIRPQSGSLQPHDLWSDPTCDMRFHVKVPLGASLEGLEF